VGPEEFGWLEGHPCGVLHKELILTLWNRWVAPRSG
jgi:hypothetical protein